MKNNLYLSESYVKKFLNEKPAFTLAEVLITLTIIGIVAAMTIPPLVTKWQDEAFAKKKQIFSQKLSEATKQMNIHEDLAPYNNTTSFVSMFKKYMKLPTICDSDKLSVCFVPIFYTGEGEEIKTASLKNSTDFGKDYSTTNVAFSILDGMTMIISYNPDCEAPDKYDVKQNNSTSSCLSYILDVNGKAKPNTIGQDIVLNKVVLNTRTCSGNKVGGLCFSSTSLKASDGDYEPVVTPCPPGKESECYEGQFYDAWSGAKLACEAMGMRMPTESEIRHVILPCDGDYSTCYDFDNDPYKYNPDRYAFYWTNTEVGNGNVIVVDDALGGAHEDSKSNANDVICVK